MASGSGGIFKCLECIHLNILDYITQVYSSIFRYIQVDVCSRQFVSVPGGSGGGRLETTTQVSARHCRQAGGETGRGETPRFSSFLWLQSLPAGIFEGRP